MGINPASGLSRNNSLTPSQAQNVSNRNIQSNLQRLHNDVSQSENNFDKIEERLRNEEKAQKDAELEDLLKETEVGKKLTAKITKIVISLILMIMFSVPLFSLDTYSVSYDIATAGITSIGQ